MNQILCSTGALIGLPNKRDYTLLKPLSGQLECDGFEFMMYSSWYDEVDEIIRALTGMKLHIPVVHCEKHIGEKLSTGKADDLEEAVRLFRINCHLAGELGAGRMVLHLWDGIVSDSGFQNNLAAYGRLAGIAGEYGIDLLVENVVCNGEDPMKHWCELAERYPDIHFIFDTKMAAFHDQLDLLYEQNYSWLWKEGRIRHYHVNDYAGGYMEWAKLRTLPIGEGHIDFEKFFSFIKGAGYEGAFTIEATAFGQDGVVDVAMLNRCFLAVRKFLC